MTRDLRIEISLLQGVVHVPKLATPVALPNNTAAIKAQQQSKANDKTNSTVDKREVEDMEIEDQTEDVVIEQNVVEISADKTNPPPASVIPNTSQPPPGYVGKKTEPQPTPFTHTGPPPPFVTNTFVHPTNQVSVIKPNFLFIIFKLFLTDLFLFFSPHHRHPWDTCNRCKFRHRICTRIHRPLYHTVWIFRLLTLPKRYLKFQQKYLLNPLKNERMEDLYRRTFRKP